MEEIEDKLYNLVNNNKKIIIQQIVHTKIDWAIKSQQPNTAGTIISSRRSIIYVVMLCRSIQLVNAKLKKMLIITYRNLPNQEATIPRIKTGPDNTYKTQKWIERRYC